MEAFRRSLKSASESALAKSQAVVLIKDVHIPNPEDIFGFGQRAPIQASTEAFWSNNTSGLDYSSPEMSPSVTYVFNPDDKKNNVNRTYTTAGLVGGSGALVASNSLILKGVANPYPGSPSKIYQAEEGFGPKEVMVLMNAAGNCENTYCPKTILDEVEFINRGEKNYYPVFDADGEAGAAPTSIRFLDSEGGQINTTLGRMQTVNTVIDKDRSLTLTEGPTAYQSSESLNEKDAETVKHVIMTSSGDDGPTFVFRNLPEASWTTQK